MRRHRHTTDSLDLMLDTICNIFGGMILMAILVVLQTRISADRLSDSVEPDSDLLLQSRIIRFDIERTQQQIDELEMQKTSFEEQYQTKASPVTAQILNAYHEFQQAVKDAIAKEKQWRHERDQYKKSMADNKSILKEITTEIKGLESEVKTIESDLKNIHQKHPKELRLPHRHNAGRSGRCYYVITGKRACVLKEIRYNGSPYTSGHCRVEPGNNILSRSAQIIPLKNSGYPVPIKGKPILFMDSLKQFNPSMYAVSFFVYGDSESFASFQKLKNELLEAGYLYSLSAYIPEEGLNVVPAAFVPVE